MRWQRAAQLAIACVVIVFVALLVSSLRDRKNAPRPEAPPPPVTPKDAQMHNPSGGQTAWYAGSRRVFDAEFGKHTSFADGRQLYSDGIRVTAPRDGRNLVITAREAEVRLKGNQLETAVFKNDVRLTTTGGVDVSSAEASYAEADGVVKIPGPVTFKKGRMSGAGVGATYDRNREVLWILDKATVTVGADKDGRGALDAAAVSAGLARAEHYVRLTKDARLSGEGRDSRADEITILMSDDEERVKALQMRGNSRITGGAGGPQAMSARDIDLTYGEDGRTLQGAHLVEQSVAEMAGGKRIAGKVINIAMAPDGGTVTHLDATENVQVDLPAANGVAARRIRAATLVANGAPGTGLQNATFSGKVDYREVQPARRNGAATDRTASSESLVIDTKPGLGDIQKADFRGNVKFVDAEVTAEAPRGIYHVERDRIDLAPSDGLPGPAPNVNDGRISVSARTIELSLGSRDLTADTRVRSTILSKKARAPRQQASRLPSLMKQDEAVNVTSNRLQYQGASSKATYTGNVKMWQEGGQGNTIKGGTIVIDDKTGNLDASGSVETGLNVEETDRSTGQKKRTLTTGKSETFSYDDKRRLATYTTSARLVGPQGNLAAHKIEVLFQAEGSNEVERLEAYAEGPALVTIKEGKREVVGSRLTYTAADQKYLMIGTPVTMIEEEDGGMCRVGVGITATFVKGAESGNMAGEKNALSRTTRELCSAVKR